MSRFEMRHVRQLLEKSLVRLQSERSLSSAILSERRGTCFESTETG